MFINQILEGLKDPKDNPCWKGYKPVGTKKKGGKTVPNCVPESRDICSVCGQTPCNCTHINEGAYDDGVNDGIRGTPNRRASSIYGPSTGEYDRGYQVGLQKGKEQQQARLAQAQQDSAPYEKMSDGELIQLRKDIQQRSTERQKIYSKLRGADFSFDPKRHLPANDAELKAQHAKDNKAWHIINQVLQQRGVNINKLGESEGSKFGSIYAEQLAQQTFDIKPDLKDENEVLNLGYSIAVRELGPRARGFFRDEDFPSDFVSAYGWLQDQRQQGVAEGMDDTVAFEIDSENAYNHVMKRFGSVIDWDGDAMVVPRRYWPAVQEVAHDAGGAATEYGTEGMAESFIAPALSAANANAEHRRQGAAGGGYRGRIDIPVQSREDYISAGRALKKAAAAAGQKIEYGLSNGVMSVFSDSMDSDTLDQFIDSVLGQGVAEAKADPTSTWVVYNGDKVKRFKTHQGAKVYAEQHGGKVASSAHYADKIQGKQGVAESDYDIRQDPTYQKYNPETHTMMYKDGKHKAVKHDQVAKAKSLGWKVRSSLKAFAKGQGSVTEMDKSQPSHGRDGRISHSTYGSRDKGGSQGQERTAKAIPADKAKQDALDILKKQGVAEGDKNKEANYDKKYQDMVQRAGQSVKNIEKKFGPVDIKSLAQRLNDIEQGKK